MDPTSRGLLALYLAQALVGAVQVGIFAYFFRLYRQDYLRYWAWSFAALCVYLVAAGGAIYMVSVERANLVDRFFWSWLSQVASYLQMTLLLAGSLAVGGSVRMRTRTLVVLLVIAAGVGTAISLAYAFSADGAAERVFLRVGLRFGVSGLAFIATAIVLARRRASVPGLGLRLVIAAFGLYGLMMLQESGFFALQFRHGQPIAGTEYLGLFDLVAQACIGFGLIIWVAEEERRRANRAIQLTEHLRSYDATTGLANRNLALRRIDADLAKGGDGTTIAVLAIDFADLASTAKWLGFSDIETIAMQVAERLHRRFGQPALRHARIQTDRFLMSVAHPGDGDSLIVLANHVLAELETPYDVGGSAVSPSLSIGIAISPHDGADGSTLLRRAEAAAQGTKHGIGFYSAERDAATRRGLAFAGRIRSAYDAREFVPYFQPIVRAGSHDVIGFEILARWRHPDCGLLLPVDFIGTVEECGLLPAMDMRLLGEACSWAADARLQDSVPSISVNVSSKAFEQEDFLEQVRTALAHSGLAPHRLQIEITESTALADTSRTRSILTALRADGVRIALDDFGIGFSSLAQLRDLPVDSLKIDRSFVQEALEDRKTAAIVDSITLLARKLQLDIVAEGVESLEEVAHFESLGVTHLQGFLFGEAVDDVEAVAMAGTRLAMRLR